VIDFDQWDETFHLVLNSHRYDSCAVFLVAEAPMRSSLLQLGQGLFDNPVAGITRCNIGKQR
jgi:hypothetical protein